MAQRPSQPQQKTVVQVTSKEFKITSSSAHSKHRNKSKKSVGGNAAGHNKITSSANGKEVGNIRVRKVFMQNNNNKVVTPGVVHSG